MALFQMKTLDSLVQKASRRIDAALGVDDITARTDSLLTAREENEAAFGQASRRQIYRMAGAGALAVAGGLVAATGIITATSVSPHWPGLRDLLSRSLLQAGLHLASARHPLAYLRSITTASREPGRP